MMRSVGILSPPKSPDCRQGSPQEEEPEETFATRAKEQQAEAKAASKFVRVLIVLAYILSVSMAAILLSLYYVLVWDPPKDSNGPKSPMAFRDVRSNMTFDVHIDRSQETMRNDFDDGHSHTTVETAPVDTSTFPFQLDNSFNVIEDEIFPSTNTESLNDTNQASTPSATSTFDTSTINSVKLNNLLLKKITKSVLSSKTSNDT